MRSQNIQRDLSLVGDDLIKKFILKDSKASKYVNSFFSEENILNHSKNKTTQFKDDQRNILTEELTKQYSKVETSDATLENIKLLSNPNTLSVTTGHQLNIFSGPLMVIYKIAQVISTTNYLNLKIKNFNYVPVFWIASEDHDFEEISEVNLHKNKINWKLDSKNLPVGEIKLNDFKQVKSAYKNSIIDFEYKDKLESIIDDAYKDGETLSTANIKFINSLFAGHGLVIIDSNRRVFKKTFLDNFKNEILDSRCYVDSNSQISKIKNDIKSFKPQVNPSDINFFKITKNGRKRIRKNGKKFIVDDEDEYTLDEIINQIESYPELFSPNVLMRALYQEKILPNVCYVGGPNELKYWMQLKLYFENSSVQFPILKLRTSAFILDKKTSIKITKSNIEMKYFFGKLDDLLDFKINTSSKLNLSFDSLKTTLTNQFDELRRVSIKTNESFIGALNAQEKKQIKGLVDLEKKLRKAEKKNHETEVNKIKSLFESLHPNDSDQERYLNFGNFYSFKGQELIDYIVDKVLISDDKILVINLED
ncbi:MAG: bacillithiol biosynthesis cysteine-adding enzyme BshC [Cryomorphaceae bacterium]|jgi:bacillithiol biosynthesis cysteine-adding enzyme BshC|nr:bacillithiol biosynthesis cysteine-adding enzyme BshC [Cryomorphaceae bacterium]MBT3503098.1 bacillithiol biosynthesis cysteine-adding enzyme BshC [Cryomorphaceae bacterium]MBT3689619.1 bacillithiol biosynthesis cysteine-adding enzyme BshC [Cryomorphaceae bacterium]MBT4221660.1 bacillithiol biosynthesis cysteine-adding enzyme BshC [Cryomorphaceae bacterium]MBT4294059.1 bacillithiol biosynthesis cysteine-adding enzyme BshC [Cryomorphaceae bacterium]